MHIESNNISFIDAILNKKTEVIRLRCPSRPPAYSIVHNSMLNYVFDVSSELSEADFLKSGVLSTKLHRLIPFSGQFSARICEIGRISTSGKTLDVANEFRDPDSLKGGVISIMSCRFNVIFSRFSRFWPFGHLNPYSSPILNNFRESLGALLHIWAPTLMSLSANDVNTIPLSLHTFRHIHTYTRPVAIMPLRYTLRRASEKRHIILHPQRTSSFALSSDNLHNCNSETAVKQLAADLCRSTATRRRSVYFAQ